MKREKPQCCAAYWERAFFYVSCDSSTLRSHVHGLELDCYPLLKSLHNTLKTLSRKSLPLIREGGPPIYDRMLPVMRDVLWEMFYERFNWCLFFNFTGQAMLAIAHSQAFKPNHRNLKTTSLPSDSSTRKMSSQRCCNLHKDKLPKGRQVVGSLTAPVCMPDYPRAVSWTLNYSRCVHLRVKDVNGGKYVESLSPESLT